MNEKTPIEKAVRNPGKPIKLGNVTVTCTNTKEPGFHLLNLEKDGKNTKILHIHTPKVKPTPENTP